MKLPRLLYFAEKKMKLVRRAFFSATRLDWTHTAQRLDYCRGETEFVSALGSIDRQPRDFATSTRLTSATTRPHGQPR